MHVESTSDQPEMDKADKVFIDLISNFSERLNNLEQNTVNRGLSAKGNVLLEQMVKIVKRERDL